LALYKSLTYLLTEGDLFDSFAAPAHAAPLNKCKRTRDPVNTAGSDEAG